MIAKFQEILYSVEVNSLSATLKLMISFLLGSIIGIERQSRRQNAGLRTFALICMASAAAMLLSIWIPQQYPHFLNGDPGRIAAQILTGIGFLGAGAIIQSRGNVHGLTTAASIWVIAIIGMCVGAGMYVVAIVLTLLSLFVLIILERLDKRRALSGEVKLLTIRYNTVEPNIENVKLILKKQSIFLFNISIIKDYELNNATLHMKVQIRPDETFDTLFESIRQEIGVVQIHGGFYYLNHCYVNNYMYICT